MPVGLLCALGTSLCYGLGSVLQSAAAADTAPAARVDPRVALALLGTWRYPAGLALDAGGFALSLVALRALPLYVVQSVTCTFLAVTAVAGVVVLGQRLRPREVAALGVVLAGLVLVGLSAAPEAARALGTGVQWMLLGAAAALALACLVPTRLHGRGGVWLLGAAGGLAFGVVAVAARALSAVTLHGPAGGMRAVLAAPALYALLLAAPLGLTAYASALQRGTVVQATAPLVVGETLLPAVAGLVLLGDHPRAGWGAPAATGFVLAVGASLLLSRFGDVDASGERHDERIDRRLSG